MTLCRPCGFFPCLWHYKNWGLLVPQREVFYPVSTVHVINRVSTLSTVLINFPFIPVSPSYLIKVLAPGN